MTKLKILLGFLKTKLQPIVNYLYGKRKIMQNKQEQFLHDLCRWMFVILTLYYIIPNVLLYEMPFWAGVILMIGLYIFSYIGVENGIEKKDG